MTAPASPAESASPTRDGGICVMGRRAFGTGIGQITDSFLELLARKYDVRLFDLHAPASPGETVRLPGGREVRMAHELSGFRVYVYVDVLWNGVASSSRYVPPPSSGYRIACLAFDSDRLPPEWVEILNRDFDTVYFTSAHLIEIAVASGVTIPVGALPLGVDLEAKIARAYRPVPGRVRFGTLSAFHPRKGLETVVGAFLREFANSAEAELVIHSNLAIGPTAAAVRSMVDVSGAGNVRISTEDLSEAGKDELLETFDVYVNASAGEGYSIGPREALALGKALVATDLGAHAPLFGAPGTFPVASSHDAPAIYPEIDHRQFGLQRVADPDSLRSALRQAFDFVRSEDAARTAGQRKRIAADFCLQAMERTYWAVVDPDARSLRPGQPLNRHAVVPEQQEARASAAAGRHGTRLGARRLVVRAQDAGFFSLFNTYVSHLVWSMQDSPQRLVLPDWDAGRLLEAIAPERPVSFCYSRPGQGNLWNHLFEPPYDLAPADLDDVELLRGEGSEAPEDMFNASREPLLTYIHAFRLYASPEFSRIRRQYHSVIREHVRLKAPLQAEIDSFLATHRDGRFLVAAHVKHPSHVIEQPDGTMADRHAYVSLVRKALADKGISESSEDWAVFLATEQERVVDLFTGEFGDHVIRFSDVQRISTDVDNQFDALPDEQRRSDGHQLQHQMAADMAHWSPRLAWEVIRDAHVMASADVLFHAVSNVATAASFLGPDVDMRFASA